jgi:hypothetical protein
MMAETLAVVGVASPFLREGRRLTYVLTLRTDPDVDGPRAPRLALKVMARRFGLRCVALRAETPVLDEGPESRVARVI